MTNTTQQITEELTADKARLEQIRKEIAGCRGAMAFLKPCMRPMNQKRIFRLQDERDTLEALIDITERNGVEEVARCEDAARAEHDARKAVLADVAAGVQFHLQLSAPLTVVRDFGDFVQLRDAAGSFWTAEVTKLGKLRKNSVRIDRS